MRSAPAVLLVLTVFLAVPMFRPAPAEAVWEVAIAAVLMLPTAVVAAINMIFSDPPRSSLVDPTTAEAERPQAELPLAGRALGPDEPQ